MADAPRKFGSLRADLPVPLPPAGPVAAAARRALTALHEPAFGRAHRWTPWLLGVAVVLVLSRFAVVAAVRPAVEAAGIAVVGYAVARAFTLVLAERHQARFAPLWLADRSDELRAKRFELLRCTVNGRACDLDDPTVVRELTGRTDNARVVLDFTDGGVGLERLYRHLPDVEFRPMPGPGRHAAVRFPEGRYELQPSGRSTFWLLGKPVVLTALPAAPAGARAGTRSTDRPA